MDRNNQKIFGGACCRDNWQKLRSRERSHPGKFSTLSRQEQAQKTATAPDLDIALSS